MLLCLCFFQVGARLLQLLLLLDLLVLHLFCRWGASGLRGSGGSRQGLVQGQGDVVPKEQPVGAEPGAAVHTAIVPTQDPKQLPIPSLRIFLSMLPECFAKVRFSRSTSPDVVWSKPRPGGGQCML